MRTDFSILFKNSNFYSVENYFLRLKNKKLIISFTAMHY